MEYQQTSATKISHVQSEHFPAGEENVCPTEQADGIVYFLVKEKVRGKNKLIPRLLGVTKDSVLSVDEKSKKVLKEWPLEHVMRWAASPSTFTLDFGDYQDSYYIVQTKEGEKITQVISTNVDALLKKRKARDHFGIIGDEGSLMLEEIVEPARAILISRDQLMGLNLEVGAIKGQVIETRGPMEGKQPEIIDTCPQAQHALIAIIDSAADSIQQARDDLDKPLEGPDPSLLHDHKEEVENKLATMGDATAEVVQQSSIPDDIDHSRIGAAVDTISSNLPDVSRGVRNIAALLDEPGQSDLINATRKLCNAFADLLVAVHPGKPSSQETLLTAASRVADYSHAIIEQIEEATDQSKEFQEILVGLAKSVADSTAQLVLRAKAVSAFCPEQQLQDRVINSATQCAFATSQLVACARIVAPTIDSPGCQAQLTNAAKQVAYAVESLLRNAELSYRQEQGDNSLQHLKDAARNVTKTLSEVLLHLRNPPRGTRIVRQERELEVVITSTDKLLSYSGSSTDMTRQAKVLSEATNHLVSHVQGDADVGYDSDNSKRFMEAARRLADATSKMIEVTKSLRELPQRE